MRLISRMKQKSLYRASLFSLMFGSCLLSLCSLPLLAAEPKESAWSPIAYSANDLPAYVRLAYQHVASEEQGQLDMFYRVDYVPVTPSGPSFTLGEPRRLLFCVKGSDVLEHGFVFTSAFATEDCIVFTNTGFFGQPAIYLLDFKLNQLFACRISGQQYLSKATKQVTRRATTNKGCMNIHYCHWHENKWRSWLNEDGTRQIELSLGLEPTRSDSDYKLVWQYTVGEGKARIFNQVKRIHLDGTRQEFQDIPHDAQLHWTEIPLSTQRAE